MREDEARLQGKKVARLVKRLYSASCSFRNWKVFNVAALANLPFKLHIDDLALALNSAANIVVLMHRSRFVVVELQDSRARAKISNLGCVDVMRARSVDEAANAMKALMPTLSTCGVWW